MSKRISYKCPACEQTTLMIDDAGFLVCSLIGCKDPGLVHDILSRELIWEKGDIPTEDDDEEDLT